MFLIVGLGYFIHHKITKPNVPVFVPLLECDFDTGAVWNRGDGVKEKARVEEEERAALAEGRKGWVLWNRVRRYAF